MAHRSSSYAPVALITPVLLIAGSAIPAAHAGTIYSTGFESPAFTIGPIAGQDGWNVFGPGNPFVSGLFSNTGSQSVFVDGNEAAQSGPYHMDATTGPIVDLSANLAIFSASTQTEWQFGALDPTMTQFLGGVVVFPDDTFEALTAGFPVIGSFPRATAFDSTAWHSIDLLFNLSLQTYSIAFDGVALASDLPFCGDNAGCGGANVASYGAGIFDSDGISSPGVGSSGSIPNDSGYLDNFQVAQLAAGTAPEPSTMLLLGLGLAGAAIKLRRR
jgi:PEP-CTERM motif